MNLSEAVQKLKQSPDAEKVITSPSYSGKIGFIVWRGLIVQTSLVGAWNSDSYAFSADDLTSDDWEIHEADERVKRYGS